MKDDKKKKSNKAQGGKKTKAEHRKNFLAALKNADTVFNNYMKGKATKKQLDAAEKKFQNAKNAYQDYLNKHSKTTSKKTTPAKKPVAKKSSGNKPVAKKNYLSPKVADINKLNKNQKSNTMRSKKINKK